jgi:hypothetical protein
LRISPSAMPGGRPTRPVATCANMTI